MRNDRHDNPFRFHVQPREYNTHGEVDEQMRKVKVNHCEQESTAECGNPEAEPFIQGTENDHTEDDFFHNRSEDSDDDNRKRSGGRHFHDHICIFRAWFNPECERFDQCRSVLGSEREKDTEERPEHCFRNVCFILLQRFVRLCPQRHPADEDKSDRKADRDSKSLQLLHRTVKTKTHEYGNDADRGQLH